MGLRFTVAIFAVALAAVATVPAADARPASEKKEETPPPAPPPSGAVGHPRQSDFDTAEQLMAGDRFEEALPLLQSILNDNPNDAGALTYVGFANRRLGYLKEALAYYQRAIAKDPDYKRAHMFLGELYIGMGEIAKARAELAEVKRICVTNCVEAEYLASAIATEPAKAE